MGVDMYGYDFFFFNDIEESVCEDVVKLYVFLLILDDVVIFGVIYDVDIGCMVEVK